MTKLADWVSLIISDKQALSEIEESENRIQRAYQELLSGYSQDPMKILNETVRVKEYNGVVQEDDIHFISLCAHHFLPFFGTATVKYVPNNIITGLGKIPRLVDALARRCQIQELLTRDIALTLEKSISAKGVAVSTQALHLCMHGRGPRAIGTVTTCHYQTGCLATSEND